MATGSRLRRKGPAGKGKRGRTRAGQRGSCARGRTRTVRGSDVRLPPRPRPPPATRSRCRHSPRWTRRCDSSARGEYRPAPPVPSRTSRVGPVPGTRPALSAGVLQDAFRAGRHRVPNREGFRQRGPTAVREPVVLSRHAALRLLPPALHELALLEPAERRVQRPLLQIEKPVRPVPQFAEDLEAVLLLLREEGQQTQLDRALLQLRGPLRRDFGHPVRLVSGPRYIGFRSQAEPSPVVRVRTSGCT